MFKGFSTYKKTRPSFTLTGIELVKQDLYNHFMTPRGSRLMRPEYGCDIYRLIFEPLDDITRSDIETEIMNVIDSEPRVSLVDFELSDSDHGVAVELLLNFENISTESLYLFYSREQEQ